MLAGKQEVLNNAKKTGQADAATLARAQQILDSHSGSRNNANAGGQAARVGELGPVLAGAWQLLRRGLKKT